MLLISYPVAKLRGHGLVLSPPIILPLNHEEFGCGNSPLLGSVEYAAFDGILMLLVNVRLE